jgi:hypothetical protein
VVVPPREFVVMVMFSDGTSLMSENATAPCTYWNPATALRVETRFQGRSGGSATRSYSPMMTMVLYWLSTGPGTV